MGGRLWWRRLLRWWGLDRLYCRECELKGAREYFQGYYWARLFCRGWVLDDEGGFGVIYSPVEYCEMWEGRGVRFCGFFCPL